MESKWQTKKLGEIINLKRGYDLPQKKRISNKIPIMSSSGINGFHNESKVLGPGVVTGRSGQLGKVFYIEEDYWPLNTTLYVEDFKGNNPLFIYYLLQTLQLENYNAGSSVPTLNRNHVHLLDVKIPSVSIQKSIGTILYKLEEKITLNNELLNRLENICSELFKHWFIDFEFPNEQGQPYQSSGGEMIVSELGEIPKIFTCGTIKDFCDLKYGKALTKKNRIPGQYPVYGSGGVNGTHNSYLVQGPGLIVGRKGSIGTLYLEFDSFYPIDTVFYTESKQYTPTFLYLLFKQYDFTKANNDSAVPGLNRDFVYNTKAVVPDLTIVNKFEEIIEPIYINIRSLLIENHKLEELRDILLPKLLSGEIKISDELVVD